MGLRIPLPWEADQTPRKVSTDLDPVDSSESTELRAARAFSAGMAREDDANRTRRGAAGAAGWVYDWMSNNGISTTRDAVRDRVNTARRNAALKRNR